MAASACDLSQCHHWRIVFFFRYFSGSLVHLPVENLSKQSSLSSVGCEPQQKSLPLIVEERAAGTTAFKVTQLGCFFIRKISNRGCDEGLLLSFLIRGEFLWIDHLSHVRIPRLFELSLLFIHPVTLSSSQNSTGIIRLFCCFVTVILLLLLYLVKSGYFFLWESKHESVNWLLMSPLESTLSSCSSFPPPHSSPIPQTSEPARSKIKPFIFES